jgi:hypothetical protein
MIPSQPAPSEDQVISVSDTYPVEVLVLMKLSTWPGLHPKYSPVTFGAINADALLAVTTAVESMVIHRANVEAMRTCLV